MKLLMITRQVDKNGWLAGFTYNWVKKIGEKVERLDVICLEKGEIAGLPPNVLVYSLGKEIGVGKIAKILKFNSLAWKLVSQVDGIFCHMNPEYTIAIAPYAKIFRKRIISWYTHSAVTFRLKVLEKLADVILTASKESFRLLSKKVAIVGHGIDVEIFQPFWAEKKSEIFQLVSVGRISPTKDYESMIKALDFLAGRQIKNLNLKIIGGTGLKDQKIYFDNLKLLAKKTGLENRIEFVGSVPNYKIPEYLKNSDIFINLSGTGSIDKAVLEAMACGCLVLTSNEAFADILPRDLMVEKDRPDKLAEKIKWLMELSANEVNQLRQKLREEVVKNHNLDNLAKKIVAQFK